MLPGSAPTLPLYVLALWALACAANAGERSYLSRDEIQATLIGKPIVSHNLASGRVSEWEFHSDGHVDAVNRSGPGRATGTWSFRPDGSMCVTMLSRTGCRFWFRQDGVLVNADTRAPDAPPTAEVRFR